MRVVVNYEVVVLDEELVFNTVEGRGHPRPTTIEQAVTSLFEADSCDLKDYPPDRLRLVDVTADVAVAKP